MKYQIIAIVSIVFILWFSIIPVELYWQDTDLQFNIVICVISAVATLMLIWRKQRIIPSAIDMIVTSWFAYVMLRGYVETTYPCANFILRIARMVTLYVCLRILFSSVTVSERVIVILFLICAIYEAIVGTNQMINGSSRHYFFSMTGSFLNPGPYSIFLSMGLVMSCQLKKLFISYTGILSSLCRCLPLIFLIPLPATWSRAAFLSAIICLGIIYWNHWKRWRWYFFAGLIGVMTFMYLLKQGSADGRSIIYMISLLCIGRAPIFGSGISSYCHQYAECMAHFSIQHPSFNYHSADVTTSAYNCLLQIGVEQGIIGIAFAFALVIMMFVRLHKTGRVLSLGLLCLLIFSMFSYPFDQLPYQIFFVMTAAYAGTYQKDVDTSFCKYQYIKKSIIPFSLLCLISITSIFSHQQIKERSKAEADYRMIAGMSSTAFLDDYYELLPLMTSNEHFLFDFSKILIIDGRHNDSNAILRLGTLINTDPMFYVVQGNNYHKMGFYKEAETAYKKAFNVMPNRLYPLYQLMLLYQQEGRREYMLQMAQRVVSFPEKVTSPATEEMKKKAKDILLTKSFGEYQ